MKFDSYIVVIEILLDKINNKMSKFVYHLKTNHMKGISYITDNRNNKKAVIIDLKIIEQHEEEVHEFIDILIAESRKNDEKISWEDAKKILKKKGKI